MMSLQAIRKPLFTLCAFTLSVTMIGCANHVSDKAAVPRETFNTHITLNDTKQFKYLISMPGKGARSGAKGRPEKGSKPGGGSGGGKRKNRDKKQGDNKGEVQKMQHALNEGLARLLAANQYCRQGHVITVEEIQAHNAIVYGECQETASENDRQRFPNHVNRATVIEEAL